MLWMWHLDQGATLLEHKIEYVRISGKRLHRPISKEMKIEYVRIHDKKGSMTELLKR